MATLRINVVVCDVCKDQSRPAQRWYMTPPGEARRGLDLCEEHSRLPLADLVDVKGAGRQGARKVFSPDEVADLKNPPKKRNRR